MLILLSARIWKYGSKNAWLKEIRHPRFFDFKDRAEYHLHRVIDNNFVYYMIKLEEAMTRIMSSMQEYKLK